MSRLESLIAENGGPEGVAVSIEDATTESWIVDRRDTYLNEMPYWATCSKPDFQTRVTSQALVAWSLHDRKAETGFPPTEQTFIS